MRRGASVLLLRSFSTGTRPAAPLATAGPKDEQIRRNRENKSLQFVFIEGEAATGKVLHSCRPSLMPPLLTCGTLSLSQSTICELLKRQGYTVQFEGFVELCKEVFLLFLIVHALTWSSDRLIWSWPRGEHRTADIHLREAWSPSSGCRPCSLPWSAFFINSMRYFTLLPLRRTAHSYTSPSG